MRIVDVYGNGGSDPNVTIHRRDLDMAFGVPVHYRIETTILEIRAMIAQG